MKISPQKMRNQAGQDRPLRHQNHRSYRQRLSKTGDDFEKGSNRETQLANLVRMDNPDNVLKEVSEIICSIHSAFDLTPVEQAFELIVALFNGENADYRACNTDYHDLYHTTDVFLAMGRMLHGAVLEGFQLNEREIQLGLIAALFHDSGYLQPKDDSSGTGAKYTPVHEERSTEYLASYSKELGLSGKDVADCTNMIYCTRLSTDIATIPFRNDHVTLIGKILGAADVIAQMADRKYLEKLLFLYYEFKESNIGGYTSELDLLRRTPGFFDFVDFRLATVLDRVDRFILTHLKHRWGIDKNLYTKAIHRHRNYLEKILAYDSDDPRNHLKREGIVELVRKRYKNGIRRNR